MLENEAIDDVMEEDQGLLVESRITSPPIEKVQTQDEVIKIAERKKKKKSHAKNKSIQIKPQKFQSQI